MTNEDGKIYSVLEHDSYYEVKLWRYSQLRSGWRPDKIYPCLRAHVFPGDVRFYRPLRWSEGLGEVRCPAAEHGIYSVRKLTEQEVEAYICEDKSDW